MTATGARRAALASAALLLAGCAAGPASPGSTSAPPASDPSSLAGRDIGLQLRPVLDVRPADAGRCPGPSSSASASADAAAASPVTACSTDSTLVYSLGPALVDGTRWDSLRAVERDGASEIDALLDPVGASALTKATADLSTEDEPRNQLAVYAEGVVLAAPTVVQPIYGGVLVIAGEGSLDATRRLVDRLTG